MANDRRMLARAGGLPTGLFLIAIFGIIVSLGGCAQSARQEDAQLVKAGFTKMPADARQSAIASGSLPPHVFTHRIVQGVESVLYADPDGCNCVYSGTLQNYTQYKYNIDELEAERAHSGGP